MNSKKFDSRKLNLILILSALLLISATCIFIMYSAFDFPKRIPAYSVKDNITLIDSILDRDKEIRALWIATVSNINFPSSNDLSSSELKSEIDDILNTAIENSMNTIVFQVRPASDALYKSEIFPSSAYLCQTQGSPFPDDIDITDYLIKEAHKLNIAVCAWINPFRVTTSSTDLTVLAENNPARMHPECTVAYGNALYYNPGLPKVRELICSGVQEIVNNYDIDAIVFDDYFYPYPKENEQFNDKDTYKKYASSLSLEDWRRNNINTLIRQAYNTVKEADPSCYFGISPFGIWQNDNGTNGGSKTKGLSAYSATYCDAKSWIDGKYIDFISPQIYWNFDHSAAPYAELVDWWDEQLKDADIPLIVSHAVYRIEEWGIEDEIEKQITYARTKNSYLGSAMYGYSAVKSNSKGICEVFDRLY